MSENRDFLTTISKSLRTLEGTLGIEACELEGDFVDPGRDDFDPAEFDISASSRLVLFLPRTDVDGIELTYEQLPDFASEVSKAELVDDMECWTPKRLLVRVENVGSYESHLKLDAMIDGDSTLQSTVDPIV